MLLLADSSPTWIVVAHRGGARLVEEREDGFKVIETLDFPEGREGPRSNPSGEPSQRGTEPRDSARAHAASVFASQLATRLEQGRNARSFRELVLIAPPQFLGTLRRALDTTTASLVRGTLDKDLGGLNDRELLKRLEKL
jgi:protein required for attachment to host cells